MPVTVTAKRALRGSKNKEKINKILTTRLEVSVRLAKKSKKVDQILSAMSLADRASKKKIIHKNKAARIKSQLSKLFPKTTSKTIKKGSSKKVVNKK